MSGKTIPAIKKPATSTNKSTGPEEASITTIKKATSKNLQGTATLTYHIGLDDTSALYWKIHANSGNGMFSNQWVAFADIQKALADWPDELPVTSTTLRPLLTGSVNTSSFLLATLVNEGILQQVPDKKRHYQLGDAKPFLAEMDKLQATHSPPGKARPRAKAKAGARITKKKPEPATGK
jgi:hypothetical protein